MYQNFQPDQMDLIREGYRFIPLYNIRNDCLTDKTGATLFVNVTITPPSKNYISKAAKINADERFLNSGSAQLKKGKKHPSYLMAVEK